MKELEIRVVGAPILRQKSIDILKVTKEVYDLIRDMFFTMYSDDKGVGLAAPQVGEGVRIIVTDVTPDRKAPMVLINPVLSAPDGESIELEECLSVPGGKIPVKRATTIEVAFINELGNPLKIRAQGILARVIQHEVDHLDGKLIIDYVSDVEKEKICPGSSMDRAAVS